MDNTNNMNSADSNSESLKSQLLSLSKPFWMVNVMEMFERLAFYGVRVVMPIYIAQADEIGGLHFTQADKGLIFFFWALFESITPMVSGGFADRYGFKKTIGVSIVIKVIGYILMATQREFYPFLFGCCVLATGTAIFKPGVQGTMVHTLNRKNSSVGWGAFYMVVNIGAFLGPPVAHFLYGISWPAVFYGCAALVSLNFLVLFTYDDVPFQLNKKISPLGILKMTMKNLADKKIILFIIIISGFWLMLMQLFDMLPNFIVDWVDSSQMVHDLNLPDWMLQRNSTRGDQIAQEWLINSNAAFIVVGVVFVSWLVSKISRLTAISMGIMAASIGLMLAGLTNSGYFCLMGILIFTVGEMLSSPKVNEFMGVISPKGKEGLYQGYVHIPRGIGWAVGSIFAGNIYGKMGDKANLALDYLQNNYNITGIERTEAMNKLMEVTQLNAVEATELLWNQYDPYQLWYPFALVGVASAIGMFFYGKWIRKTDQV